MGPFSGVLFLIGAIMVLAGRNRNNDDLFDHPRFGRGSLFDTPEQNRIKCMIMGVLFIIAAVAMWVYLAINGEPAPLPDYSSLMNRNSSG